MKKLISFLLAVVLCFTLAAEAFAASVKPEAVSETVQTGQNIAVAMTVDESYSDVITLETRLYYNSDLFTYVSYTEDNKDVTVKATPLTDANGTYMQVTIISATGGAAVKANEKIATLVFAAKDGVTEQTSAEFKSKIQYGKTKDGTEISASDMQTYSVTVTPASTEVKGYAVAASAVNSSITVKEDAQVALKISNNGVNTYNAYYMEVSYDTSVLTYKGINTDVSVIIDNSGILKIAGYGDNKTCGTDNIILTFTGKATGEAKVTVTSAKVDVKDNAAAQNAPDATITTDAATITVGGYQVSLPDGFTADSMVAEPNKDYTFTANDTTKKYDFTGSTMGGNDVEVIDIGNGTYTVKNVTGPLDIKATALVTIEETGNGWGDVSRSGWTQSGDTVKVGTALNMTIEPKEGRTYTVTVNGTELTIVRPGMTQQVYTIPASMVTGNKLTINVTYTETGTDTITIIETGDAWSDVTLRGTWKEGGGAIDMSTAGTEYVLKFKPAKDKTKDDYVVTINGTKMELKNMRKGEWGVSFVPNKVAVDGKITIDVSYKKTGPAITVNVSEYLNLSGKTMFLITAACDELTKDKVLAYGKDHMYWSAKYNEGSGAYAWLVISNKSLEEVKTEASAQVKAVNGTKVEIVYDGDVNQTTRVDINDAQLVWNMYNAQYSDFDTVNIRKFLEADMNGDKTVSVLDATAIVDNITK